MTSVFNNFISIFDYKDISVIYIYFPIRQDDNEIYFKVHENVYYKQYNTFHYSEAYRYYNVEIINKKIKQGEWFLLKGPLNTSILENIWEKLI